MTTENNKNAPPIAVKGLTKSFGNKAVLKGIDLTVQEGETVAVLGRSGTGKSVLLKLLIGLQKPDGGSIRINGEEVTGMPSENLTEIRKKMGFLFQQSALYDSMTVEENVGFPLARHTGMPANERKDRVRELLAKVGMEGDTAKMPSEISGGMQKRVGLARALALKPGIILFDEPTSGLDPITAAEIGELIRNLKQEQKMTAVVVTHDLHVSRMFADRFVLLDRGSILAEGTMADLEKSEDPFVKRFLQEGS